MRTYRTVQQRRNDAFMQAVWGDAQNTSDPALKLQFLKMYERAKRDSLPKKPVGRPKAVNGTKREIAAAAAAARSRQGRIEETTARTAAAQATPHGAADIQHTIPPSPESPVAAPVAKELAATAEESDESRRARSRQLSAAYLRGWSPASGISAVSLAHDMSG
jgi:hypothetical protein